ncbi:aminotransferase class I/II-fold pyridoxal phosphate-dependent enzyme [Hyphomicrobium sp. 99]|uniref:aminotransferase class I/II-fold pyridoxal phosphate-dependent enzyme n=1 Tax=Hyphomicrobium sp. 99 TaxID=1163419 RepID=UPI000698261C|nr:aminotransferase class I/II-fold pyridoxal phosphate-dependent enzyme [Hyphomicrobium sp. 99]
MASITRALKPCYRKAAAFSDTSLFQSIRQYQMLGQAWGVENPFFKIQESRSKRSVTIDGRQLINFGWCDYLGLSDHPKVLAAAKSAIDEFGSCISASRMVSGDLQMHRQLETELAEFFGFENALVFVSGRAASVSTIGTLLSKGDLVVHDELVHNSAIVGARLSGAEMKPFKHNNLESLIRVLLESRERFKNVLIVVEGLYSTEGDCVNLSRLVQIKQEFGCWLMVDDAHGVGVLGESGRGLAEYAAVDPRKIDIYMGTLSKALASCGGFIAGNAELNEILKYSAPAFVYSVGLPPAVTAAALASLRILRSEPERVHRLHDNCKLFFGECRARGFDTGTSIGLGMIPIMVGSVKKTGRWMELMIKRGFNPSPIIYPGVRINSSRLRFFISSEHSVYELQSCAEALSGSESVR